MHFLLLLVVVALIILILYFSLRKSTPSSSVDPFASLPPLSLSQTPNYHTHNLYYALIGKPSIDIDQNMLIGEYQRYPLNKPKQKTSIVAVSSSLDYFPFFTAWGIEVDIDTWNFVWCDSVSSYFVTPFLLTTTPVVCIKGQFPNARYMSFFSYVGPEITDSGTSLFGQGINQNASDICNSSINDPSNPEACNGLRDYQIEPDEGSKNPFIDPTYVEGDDKYFTIYLVSPYYKGSLPDSKNIIPLSVYGAKTAILLYRIYSPFNPKSCESKYYWSASYVDTMACPVSNPSVQNTLDGGAAYPQLDKTNKLCDSSDKTCLKQCFQDQLAHSKIESCRSFVGNNVFCVCHDPQNPCYAEMDRIMKQCTNNESNINHLCSNIPPSKVDDCLANIHCDRLSSQYDQQLCDQYLKTSDLQSCIASGLLQSSNPQCYGYQSPHQTCQLCSDLSVPYPSDSCQQEMNTIIQQCNRSYELKYKEKSPLQPISSSSTPLSLYCQYKCDPKYDGILNEFSPAFDPTYQFDKEPLTCTTECQRYECVNGYCIPKLDGTFTNSQCNNQCFYSKPVQENYQPSTFSSCIFHYDPKDCDVTNQRYIDIGMYGINSTPNYRLFRQGWTELPEIFIKYNYNDYFIRMTTWNLQKYWKISLLNYILPLITYQQKQISEIQEHYRPSSFSASTLTELYYDNLQDCLPLLFQGRVQDFYECVGKSNVEQYRPPSLSKDKPQRYTCDPEKFKCKKSDTGEFSSKEGCKQKCTPPPLTFTCNPSNHTCEPTDNGEFTSRDKCQRVCKAKPNDLCTSIMDPNTYLYIGSQFPVGFYPPNLGLKPTIHQSTTYSTYQTSPPNCDYFYNQCQCQQKESNYNNCCEVSLGNLDCQGNRCFKTWKSLEFQFMGEAYPFVYSGNTGSIIPFPNPDASYVGCCTSYSDDSVYILWTDIPTFPHTPDYQQIIRHDKDVRYFSFGHYFWNMEGNNLRPNQSDLVDAQLKYHSFTYTDQHTQQSIQASRMVIVLATKEQYDYLQSYHLWDSNINWLNWGKLPHVKQSASTTSNTSLQADHVPLKGILLYRQLFPSATFTEAISNFYSSACIQTKIEVTDRIQQSNLKKPVVYPKFCNVGPGVSNKNTIDPKTNRMAIPNTPLCKLYDFDPCCLSQQLLYHMKNYYPRCEKVKLCDIEKIGVLYWSRYLYHPLPYQYQ